MGREGRHRASDGQPPPGTSRTERLATRSPQQAPVTAVTTGDGAHGDPDDLVRLRGGVTVPLAAWRVAGIVPARASGEGALQDHASHRRPRTTTQIAQANASAMCRVAPDSHTGQMPAPGPMWPNGAGLSWRRASAKAAPTSDVFSSRFMRLTTPSANVKTGTA